MTTKLTEAQFQRQVLQLARLTGWHCYHPTISQFSVPGFPDLVLVRERVLFREIKTDKGQATPAQLEWITRLSDAGADVDIWRPSMWTTIQDTLSRNHALALEDV